MPARAAEAGSAAARRDRRRRPRTRTRAAPPRRGARRIDACGLKGYVRGRAAVYERQALVLVNRGGATGQEILDLAREVQDRVRQKFDIALEPEPIIV